MQNNNKIIHLVIGIPGSGKTTYAENFIRKGFTRLNRDLIGGSLDELITQLDYFYHANQITKFVLDNTYSTKKKRHLVIEWAEKNGFCIECHYLDIDIYNARYNIAQRNYQNYKNVSKPDNTSIFMEDVKFYPPSVISKFKKQFEFPTLTEGFDQIHTCKFYRNPYSSTYKNRAIIVDYDGTLRTTISGSHFPTSIDDVVILPRRSEILHKYQQFGWMILGVSNQSGISSGDLTYQQARDIFNYTNDLLGIDIDFKFCPHQAYPPVCYCRKPLPGFAIEFIEEYKLNPKECIMVGDLTSDRTFAEKSGFRFIHSDVFFAQAEFY
ncbi:MAG: HAD-IIIA family hydrolase [Promethearchaeota archaeon]